MVCSRKGSTQPLQSHSPTESRPGLHAVPGPTTAVKIFALFLFTSMLQVGSISMDLTPSSHEPGPRLHTLLFASTTFGLLGPSLSLLHSGLFHSLKLNRAITPLRPGGFAQSRHKLYSIENYFRSAIAVLKHHPLGGSEHPLPGFGPKAILLDL